jgi:hypothetical protein
MQRKTKGLLAIILLISLGAVLFVAILLLLNQPGKPNQITAELETSPEAQQYVYPASKLGIVGQSINKQSAYPPPPTVVWVSTDTAPALKVAASPTAKSVLTAENVQRTSLEDAKAAFDGKKAVFLDVRSSESYARNHVPGAISIPEAQIYERLKELDPNQWIITYCS